MNTERDVAGDDWEETDAIALAVPPEGSRRLLLGRAAGGLVLAASGLILPAWLEETEAREGALGGKLGGRHGKNRRGRTKRQRRNRRDRKGKEKDKDKPRGSGPLFRSSALTVVNETHQSFQCTFYYQTKTGLDDYAPPVADGTQTISFNDAPRYYPERYRVGALITKVLEQDDIYVDVRNVSFWFPRGGVTRGANLEPHNGNVGATFIREQDFGVFEAQQNQNIELRRVKDDSKGDIRIEWELTIRRTD